MTVIKRAISKLFLSKDMALFMLDRHSHNFLQTKTINTPIVCDYISDAGAIIVKNRAVKAYGDGTRNSAK